MKTVAVILLVSLLICLTLIFVIGCASPALPNSIDTSLRFKLDTNSPQIPAPPAPSGALKSSGS